MSNRPAGGDRSKRHPREPLDWYCESQTAAGQIMDAIDFDNDLILDPTCGRGNLLDVAKRRGHPTVGIDLVERRCVVGGSLVSERHSFARGDFLKLKAPPKTNGRALSIFCNPPYSYREGICERIIRHALDLPVRLACFIVPIAFLAAEERYHFFTRDFKPAKVAVFSERPSMPPGSTLTPTTEFKGGMADYIALIYEPPHRAPTETIWLRPSNILPG